MSTVMILLAAGAATAAMRWLSAEPGGHSNLEGANPVRRESHRVACAWFIDRLQHRLVELVHDVTAAVAATE